MGNFNNIVSIILEADTGVPNPAASATNKGAAAIGGSSPSPVSSGGNIEDDATLKAYQDLMEFFSDPELIKIIQDVKMNSKRKVGYLSNRMKKFQENPDKSKLENAIDSVKQQWRDGTKLKKAQMAMGGVSNVAKVLKKTFMPTHSGSTGVYD